MKMLIITIELEDNNEIDGYSMGHMVFKGDKNTISSKKMEPVQLMMIFISIVLLLDGIRNFYMSKNKKYEFVGTDSSFIIDFEKLKSNLTRLSHRKKEIATLDSAELISSVYNAVKIFLDQYMLNLSPDDIAYEDIVGSFKEFEAFKALKK